MSLEMIQHRGIRFISGLEGLASVTDADCELGLRALQQRRKNHRIALLMKALQDEERHSVLDETYDEISGDRKTYIHVPIITSRTAARVELTSADTNTNIAWDHKIHQGNKKETDKTQLQAGTRGYKCNPL